jgi:type II secretion system protein N
MKRWALFALLLITFVLVGIPHRLLLETLLDEPLRRAGVELELGTVRPAWPPGYRASDVRISRNGYRLQLDSLWLGPGSGGLLVEVAACGGSARLALSREGPLRRLRLGFGELDPSRCLDGAALVVEGKLTGEIDLSSGLSSATSGHGSIHVESNGGTVSGHLPMAGTDGLGIGNWSYDSARLNGRLENNDLEFFDSGAAVEGIDWQLGNARLWHDGRGNWKNKTDFRARRVGDSPRAKLLLAMLPRATESAEGWRSYRLSGNLSSPKLIGLK